MLPRDYVAEHVELGYATTVHRAQGRTADTAHAFVNATAHREGLYVAATRGREANRLYVDTLYDPDSETAHGLPPMVPAGDVLRRVLANRGAEVSATEAMEADWREQQGIAQVLAEYNTLATVALRERYDEMISHRSGLSDEAGGGGCRSRRRTAPSWRRCDRPRAGVSTSRRASRPLWLLGRSRMQTTSPAVLHERVDLWMSTAGETGPEPERISGLFPKAPTVADPDMTRALKDREALIEQRAGEVGEGSDALERQPWIGQLGAPPLEPEPPRALGRGAPRR